MQPSDFRHLVTVAAPTVSPDGRTIAYVVERVDMDAGCYRSAIWLAAADGSSPPAQFSAGAERDGNPCWSPDGRHLGFTRSPAALGPGPSGPEATRRHQVVVAPATEPGESVVLLSHADEGFGELAWSPDGQQLAYTTRVRAARYGPDGDHLRAPRKIDRIFNRLDSVGWIADRPNQVFVVATDGTSGPRQITQGAFEHQGPVWSPDSTRLAVAAARHADWDLDPASDLWVFDATETAGTAPPVCVTETVRWWVSPAWSPDGSQIAGLVSDERDGPRHARVAVVDLADRSSTVPTAALDRHCRPMPGARAPIWAGEDELLFSAEDRGRVPVLRVAADGSAAPEPVIGGERWVTGFDAAADGATIAFVATTTTAPTELFALVDGVERQLTSHQRRFVAACPPMPAERLSVLSPAGDGDIDTWVVRPPGFEADAAGGGRRYPMLLLVHGGPTTQHGERWFDEVQLYAAAGYVVAYANPHGSSGSSEAWARAVRSPLAKNDPGTGWGGIDFDDVMAVVDAVVAHEPTIDPERLGILGGSYGGYMTSWALGHTDRFAAGCSERSCNNLLTEELTSDIAGGLRHLFGINPFDHAEEYLRMSPISYARDITTPLLILHSEDDERCNIEQADELYVLLRLLRREVEYWRFPAESHEMSRSGSSVHRQQRAEIILDWFGRWLKPSSASPATDAATNVI